MKMERLECDERRTKIMKMSVKGSGHVRAFYSLPLSMQLEE
jgi:hypothetical protein